MAKFAPTMPEGGVKVDMAHAHFDRDPLAAFSGKVTEHAWLTPKEGEVDAVRSTLEKMADVLKEHPELSVGGAIGTLEEHPGQIIVILGWNSIEVCYHTHAGLRRTELLTRPRIIRRRLLQAGSSTNFSPCLLQSSLGHLPSRTFPTCVRRKRNAHMYGYIKCLYDYSNSHHVRFVTGSFKLWPQ